MVHWPFSRRRVVLVTYNILQILALFFFWPLLLLVAAQKKYRKRLWSRCGFGLTTTLPPREDNAKTIWIHALSVGEVTSVAPLVKAMKKTWPQHRIIFTVTTSTGQQTAQRLLGDTVNAIIPAPLDLAPIVRHFLQTITADIYIQVETDFWPNILHGLQKRAIPTILVNGRLSEKSFVQYKKYRFFFAPMFRNFSQLCMQTQRDKQRMSELGIPEERLHILGNLKFDSTIPQENKDFLLQERLPQNSPIFVAGSTHPGEEELILQSITEVRRHHHDLFSVIVPRDITRAQALTKLAAQFGFTATLRSAQPSAAADLLIVDSIGELIDFYRHSTVAFVGGSLVPLGGHNPIEPALFGVPILFGPHMSNFSEIATALNEHHGAISVTDGAHLTKILDELLRDETARNIVGKKAREWVTTQRGVISRHISLLKDIL